jgi:hypothetical protein
MLAREYLHASVLVQTPGEIQTMVEWACTKDKAPLRTLTAKQEAVRDTTHPLTPNHAFGGVVCF